MDLLELSKMKDSNFKVTPGNTYTFKDADGEIFEAAILYRKNDTVVVLLDPKQHYVDSLVDLYGLTEYEDGSYLQGFDEKSQDYLDENVVFWSWKDGSFVTDFGDKIALMV